MSLSLDCLLPFEQRASPVEGRNETIYRITNVHSNLRTLVDVTRLGVTDTLIRMIRSRRVSQPHLHCPTSALPGVQKKTHEMSPPGTTTALGVELQ